MGEKLLAIAYSIVDWVLQLNSIRLSELGVLRLELQLGFNLVLLWYVRTRSLVGGVALHLLRFQSIWHCLA